MHGEAVAEAVSLTLLRLPEHPPPLSLRALAAPPQQVHCGLQQQRRIASRERCLGHLERYMAAIRAQQLDSRSSAATGPAYGVGQPATRFWRNQVPHSLLTAPHTRMPCGCACRA